MSNGREERNIIMFPFMAHAHLNPFMHGTCNRIGTKGGLHAYTITIVNTPLNIQTLKSSLPSKTNIRFAEIPFHGTTYGLPPHICSWDGRSKLPMSLEFFTQYSLLVLVTAWSYIYRWYQFLLAFPENGREASLDDWTSLLFHEEGCLVPRSERKFYLTKSTGPFLSHYGWNSVLESLSQGVPIIGWPLAGQQCFNSLMLDNEVGVSIEVARGIDSATKHDKIARVIKVHFVLEENMLEVDCPCVTPEVVLKASGHDEKTGTCFRADHLLKDFCNEKLQKDLSNSITAEKAAQLKHVLAVLDDLSAEELGAKIKDYGITAPDTKNPLSDPYPFNLMFQTSISPSGLSPGYMRPETTQGIFVNFKDLYYYNGNKLPFAAARIGQAFRNEFTLAEIEHFVNPENKSHSKFPEVAKLEFIMFPREEQMSGHSAKKIPLGEEVSRGIVNNETLGYFIGRVYLFLTRLDIDENRLRQHLANEMAHYTADYWDAEIESSYGWIECVGIADRSAFDLCAHSDKSGVALVAQEKFPELREVEKLVINPVKKDLGLAFKGNLRMVVEALEAMNEKEALEMKASLESKGETEFFVCTLEKNLNVFCFPPLVAPIKCTVFPLVHNQKFEDVAKVISQSLTTAGISHRIDIISISSFQGISIGKRYARTDELGVPFAITVDSTTSVTIRERDNKDQVHVNVEQTVAAIKEVTDGRRTWANVWSTFPHHSSVSADDEI
ncbi:glycine--tRNA ligase, mitochondrial 1 [Fagus crenata]